MDFVVNDTIYDEIPRIGKSSPGGGRYSRSGLEVAGMSPNAHPVPPETGLDKNF
jgi:hypothetical protein